MKKILFLCVEGFDTPGPSNHLISSLIEDTLDNGYKVTLIQSKRNESNKDLPHSLKVKSNFESYSVKRRNIKKSSFVLRYFEEVYYAFKCFFVWRNMKDVDAVFIQSCPTVLFPISLVKLFLKKPILYSIQDMWPGSAVNSGVLSNKLIAELFYFVQKKAYKYSDFLTVISGDMKSKLSEQGVSSQKIYSIVNWFDDRSVREIPWEENKFVKKYGFSRDKFYVQYAGTMGYVFDYKMVLKVADLLKEYNEIEFQMIGRGSQKDTFIQEAKDKGIKNIKFYPLESQEMVSDVYSTCSVCLIPLKKGIIGNSVPSKAGLLMACNRPIINSVDENSDYYRMFKEKEIGLSVSNENPEKVADAILKLYNNKQIKDELARKGKIFGSDYYSRRVNTKKFIELFDIMTGVEGKE